MSLHNVVSGQCSHMLRTKLKGDNELKKINIDDDVVTLLKIISGECQQMNTDAFLYDLIDKSKMVYYNYQQIPEEDNEKYLCAFKSNSDVVGHYKGNIYTDRALIEHEKE